MRIWSCHGCWATDTALPSGVSAGMLSEQRGSSPSSPGGFAKAHAKLWPTTATSVLPEKGLLSTSQLLWICSFPRKKPFLFIPTNNRSDTWPSYNPLSHTYFSQYIPLPTWIISVPSPGKFCLLILGGRRSSWQPAPSPASHRHNPAAPSSLPCCKAPTLAVQLACLSPVFPKEPLRQGLELRHPSSSLSSWLSISIRGNGFYPRHCFLFPAWLL